MTADTTLGSNSYGIAIPFYDGLDYLREAVASVVAQSDPDWRLWVVDDSGDSGSGSETAEALVASFRDPRIRYLRNPANLGMVANWNRCLELADTDLVTLLHGDDRLLPGYVASLRRVAADHPDAVALYCGARIIGSRGEDVFSLADTVKGFLAPSGRGVTRLEGESGATALMRGNFIMCPTLCFRRQRLGARRFDESWAQVQDLALSIQLLMEGEHLVGSDEVAYAYRRHEQSATTLQSRNRLRFDEEFRLFDQVGERAAELGWHETARVSRHKRIVKLHLLYRALRDVLGLRPGTAWQTLRYLRSRSR